MAHFRPIRLRRGRKLRRRLCCHRTGSTNVSAPYSGSASAHAHGDIVLALDPVHAPKTTANFLRYVDQERFDGARFYRAVPMGEDGQHGLLQGGLYGSRVPTFKPIAHEAPAVTGLRHVDGAVSMARGAPGTAASEFFIVIGDLDYLDGKDDDPGYAVFGHVESGMDVVKQLLAMPRSPDAGGAGMHGQMLANPVKILTARRVAPGKP